MLKEMVKENIKEPFIVKELQIGVCVNGLRQATVHQAGLLKLIRKEYARLFEVDENSIGLSCEIINKEI